MALRVIFPDNCQRDFLEDIQKSSNLNWSQLAKRVNINRGTLKSYRYELCSLPYILFSNIVVAFDLNEQKILDKYSANKAKQFAINNFKSPFGRIKSNCKEINIPFENCNLDLDTAEVCFSEYDFAKGVKLPNRITPLLAEEIGMHLGDGYLSSVKYDYRLKGNKNESDYYRNFIKPMFKKLYNLDISLKEYEDVYGFELYSKAIWEFKTKVIRIPPSPKTRIRIPEKLKVANRKILCALVRGYFDTDGGIYFQTKYGYKNYYPMIQVSSISKGLIDDFGEILIALGFNVAIYENKKGKRYELYLRGYNNFKRYYNLIGWSNPKQKRKVKNWAKRNAELCKKIGLVPEIKNGKN